MTTNIVVKKLKNKDFKLIDSAVCCALFVLFQFLFDFFYRIVPTSLKANLFFAIFASILVEAVFFFAAWATSGIGKTELFEATKINKKIDYKSGLLAVAMSVICLFGFNGLTNVFVEFLGSLGYSQVVSDVVVPNFGTYILYVITICLLPAIFEETCFRGCILNGMKSLGVHKAVWFSAVIFMLMHGGPDQTIHQLIVGAICGYALVYSGSLLVPIIIHFFNNFTAITLIYIENFLPASEVEGTVASASTLSVLVSIISAVALACIATYLILICLKELKKQRQEREKKAKEKLALKTTSASEEAKSEDDTITVNVSVEEKRKNNVLMIVLFVAGIAYLVVNWISTLIVGFLK